MTRLREGDYPAFLPHVGLSAAGGTLPIGMVPVLERLRVELATRRASGAPFSDAWTAALHAALPPRERRTWVRTLEETRTAWQGAYERRAPARAERALAAAGWDADREPLPSVDPRDRTCAHCGDPIPAGRRPTARYCSRSCQRAAHGRRAA